MASRGGLAERAQHLFAQRSTALALWERDMEHRASRGHAPYPPDLALRVLAVAHVSSAASLQRSQAAPRLAAVRCAKLLKGSPVGSVLALLDFGAPGSAAERAHTLDALRDGRDVHVWGPWGSSDAAAEDLRRFGAMPRDGTTLFCTRFRIIGSSA